MRKKNLAAVIAIMTMTASLLAGCGSENGTGNASNVVEDGNGGDVYEATMMYYASNDSASGIQDVEDKLNELTVSELNIHVNLQPITWGTYDQQIQLTLSGGEQLDIFPMKPNNASSFIQAGYLVDLSEYLSEETTPNIMEWIGEGDLQCCSVGDFIWGMPVMMERTHPNAFVMRNDILQEVGINAGDIQSLDDITDVFAKVHEKYPDMVILGGKNTATIPIASMDVDFLGNVKRLGVLMNYGEKPEVVNYYETDEFAELVNYMHEWYDAGYVSKDIATCTDTGEIQMKAGNLFAYTTNTKPDSKEEKDTMTGYDTAIFEYNDLLLTTWGVNTVAYGVSAGSKDPEKAIALYDFIMGSEEANDLLNWGVEGKDWVEAEDGTATYPEQVDLNNVSYHQDFGWALPNQQNSHVWEGNDPTVFETYREAADSAKVSVAYGFTFNTSNVLDQISALSSVFEQYAYTLSSGSVDPEKGIQEFNDALYAAGLQDVIDEEQKQLDEWLANQ